MPRTIESTVYTYDELSDDAKAKARDWYREASAGDTGTLQFTVDDFAEVCEYLGIELDTRTSRTWNGREIAEKCIYWSLGYAQGDFAAFEGTYTPAADIVESIKEYANDSELFDISERLKALDTAHKTTLAKVTHSDYYGLQVTTWANDAEGYEFENYDAADEYRDVFKDLCSWFYDALRDEDMHQNEDEQVEEAILTNEYEFTEKGKRA